MTKQCELCDQAARMYCESDQASLCWECDTKVHGANFLVARHTRCLLCRSCQAPTPWRASGRRLGPTFSVCDRCLGAGACDAEKGEPVGGVAGMSGVAGRIEAEAVGVAELGGSEDDDDDDEDERDENGDDDEDEEEDDDDDEDGDGDNQVVPWSTEAAAATPPPVASCSSSEESSSARAAIRQRFLRRTRENANLSTSHWQDDHLRPSPPSAAAAARSGRMLEEQEAETSSAGDSLHHRKRVALPPSPTPSANRRRCGRLPRGGRGTVELFLPGSPSPPI